MSNKLIRMANILSDPLKNSVETVEAFERIEKLSSKNKIPIGVKVPSKKFSISVVEVSATPKIGRNELCDCGSGIKYKNCCKIK